MAQATTTTHASAIAAIMQQAIPSTLVRDMQLFQLFPPTMMAGDDSIRWITQYGGTNSAAAQTEGDATPVAGNVLTATCHSHWIKWATGVQITKEAVEDSRNGYYDVARMEIEKAIKDVMAGFQGALITQLIADLAQPGTLYGQTSATIGWTSSHYHNVAGALDLAHMTAMHEALLGSSIRANQNDLVILCENNQAQNYSEIAAGVQYAERNMDAASDTVNGGSLRSNLVFNGVPLKVLNGMTNTVMLMIERGLLKTALVRDVTIEPKSVNIDGDYYYVSVRGGLAYLNPLKAGQLYGLTA